VCGSSRTSSRKSTCEVAGNALSHGTR
jgi:hypothetical protein